MGVVTVKSKAITNADSLTPYIPVPTYLGKGEVYAATGVAAVGSADSAGSIYIFCRVPSGARISSMKITNTAMSGFSSGSVGLYCPQNSSGTAGAAVSSALFGTGIDFSVNQSEPYDVLFNNLSVANGEKRIWELLALASDPLLFYDVAVTTVTQSGASGTICMGLEYVI